MFFALPQDKLFHHHNSVSVADVAILIEILQMLSEDNNVS